MVLFVKDMRVLFNVFLSSTVERRACNVNINVRTYKIK